MIQIYNSLTSKKEPFQPIHPGKVKMYVCGVTVYDFCHLGHARTYVAFDVINRYLMWRGFEVTYVRNITDIDDKIIHRANENNEPFMNVVDRNILAMHEDFKALNLLEPTYAPRATEYIPQMISLIEKLIDKDYAYIADNGDVYYEVRKFKHYGELSHRDLDKLESGARVEIVDVKRDPLDFVLWKLAKPGEPSWDSPWGKGRPGWHTECSVMSMDLLGVHFDLHGGGKDLIFPHHENELAQSEAVSCNKFVNTWMHAGFLQINKEKMSKSLGNFFTIRDILKEYHPEIVRYFLITSHYRSQLSFSDEGLNLASNALERLYTALRDFPQANAAQGTDFEKKFIEAMDDDFNTPIAFSILFELAHEVQRMRAEDKDKAAAYAALLKRLGGILGILQMDAEKFFQRNADKLDVAKIEALIEERNKARTNKNWATADRVRKELSAMSIVLEDSEKGTTWKLVRH